MGKYAPLGEYLRRQRAKLVPMSFEEIERVIGGKLPKCRRYPASWSNNPYNDVMTQVWLDAGFETEQVDVEGHKVVFRRVREVVPEDMADSDFSAPPKRHPIIGCLKGTVKIAPGVDLTEPA